MLDPRDNNTTDNGAQHLAKFINKISQLHTLDLSNNSINDKGA